MILPLDIAAEIENGPDADFVQVLDVFIGQVGQVVRTVQHAPSHPPARARRVAADVAKIACPVEWQDALRDDALRAALRAQLEIDAPAPGRIEPDAIVGYSRDNESTVTPFAGAAIGSVD